MLTRVEITTSQGATLALHLNDLSNGYSVRDIEGLDPVNANIVSSSFARLDGEQEQSSRRESRNIVFRLGLEPDYSIGSARALRSNLYDYFMPKSKIRMRFFVEGEPDVEIYGRVESFDCPIFTKEPEATISVICHLPDFYTPEPVVVSGNTTDTTDEFVINYEGTVETGIVFKMGANRIVDEFAIYHRPSDDTLKSMEFVSPLSAGDELTISTVSGAKGATLTRENSDSSILYGVSPYSNWISLSPGPNYIRVHAEGLAVPFTIEYTNKYGGL